MNANIQFIVEKVGVSEPVATKAYALMKENLVNATFLCEMYKTTDRMGVPLTFRTFGAPHYVKGLDELYKEFHGECFPC